MAAHTKNSLRSTSISQVLNLSFAVPAPETGGTKGLVTGKDSKVLNFVSTCATAICAVVTYQRAVTEEEEICVRIEEGAAGIAAKTVNVPSMTR